LDPWLIDSLVKLLVATILGAAVGLERELHGQPAGLRTHILVCLASTLLIVISRPGALSGLSNADQITFVLDPSRITAGIVTGVGFLGAGTILRLRENMVRGLTTAACIWFVAALGIAVGHGEYILSAVATVLSLLVLRVLFRLENRMDIDGHQVMSVTGKRDSYERIENDCVKILSDLGADVTDVGYRLDNIENSAEIVFQIRGRAKKIRKEAVLQTARIEGVDKVRWS